MLKRALLAFCALCLVLAASCGPSLSHIKVRTVSEAEYLQTEAAAKNLKGDEITIADSLLARAKARHGSKESIDLADHAAAWYRIALAKESAEQSAKTLEQAEAALSISREQVEKYQDVLKQVNANAGGE